MVLNCGCDNQTPSNLELVSEQLSLWYDKPESGSQSASFLFLNEPWLPLGHLGDVRAPS